MNLDARTHKALRIKLATRIGDRKRIRQCCRDADLPLDRLQFDGSPDLIWEEVLDEVRRQGSDALKRLLSECCDCAPVLREDALVQSLSAECAPPSLAGNGAGNPSSPSPSIDGERDVVAPAPSTGRPAASVPVPVFISYAHEDEPLKEELEKHLVPLVRKGRIQLWDDRKIEPGDEWNGEIDEALNAARIVLLLVSPDFLASDFIYERELKRAMERHQKGEVRVIPIILRACDWKEEAFADFQALPKDGKAITTWKNRDEAWREVARGIRKIVVPEVI